MPTRKSVTGGKSRTAATKSLSIDIELTEEQQQKLRRESGGEMTAKVLRLRPDLNLGQFLTEMKEKGVIGSLKLDPPQGPKVWCAALK